ncbi:hypothetical protein CA54_41320 [Symmachiella macrocystis]|uniref:Phospholipase D-like domain-containing protein n=1 Tax=Symmachiella macrocystis TaxID=2527985 RepID=A0A5C6B9Y2_9PLAN|nr:phospholipase D family protein [Symmachiella macrocystis]TWU08893.1 hypothetical protein CA54_41320 [Symmachiella macrocystis]
MKFLSSPSEVESVLAKQISTCKSLRWAVAWASCNTKLFTKLVESKDKIDQLIIGIHFYQTDPDFIEQFLDHPNVKFVMNPDGVFHPKMYLFEHDGGNWFCVTGSSNFTKGGLSSNSEVAVAFDKNDDVENSNYLSIDSTLNDYFAMDSARTLTKQDLSGYRAMWKRQQRRLESLSGTYTATTKKKKPKTSPLDVAIFVMDWPTYYGTVKDDKGVHTTEGRLRVLETANGFFSSHDHFSDMNDDSRRGIAGIYETEQIDWLWFGSMKGHGYFKQAINNNVPQISEALDEIPLTGKVTEEHFDQYLTKIGHAFDNVGVGTATRLLAMKRPDCFVCLDSKNRDKLCEEFKISKNVGLDDYWGLIVARLMDSNWWNAPEPHDPHQKRIWHGRAAFLDVMFYDPK